MLELDMFMLADAASAHDGKLYVHGGGITRLNAPSLPLVVPNLSLVLRFTADDEDFEREHVLTLALRDPDGDLVIPPTPLQFGLGSAPAGVVEGEERYLQLALGLAGVPFARFGVYALTIELDDRIIKSMRLPVVEMTANAEAAAVQSGTPLT